MGQSSSSGRRRDDYYYHSSSSSQIPPPPPPIPSGSSHPPPPPNYAYSSPSRPNYSTPGPIPAPPPPPPPPPHHHHHPYTNSSYYYNTNSAWFGSSVPWGMRAPYPPAYYSSNQGTMGRFASPSSSAAATAPPPPYVEHQKAKTVKNDINLHKDSIRFVVDEHNPDQHLVSFTFDAVVDGSVTIYYFAKEGANCSFSPVYPDIYTPRKVAFQKGLGQKFIQPSGSGIDLGFFDLDDLSRPLDGDVFPLVVYAEACLPGLSTYEQVGQSTAAANAQITQAVIEKNNNGSFQVKVIKQILWAENERYELQEIYGIANSVKAETSGDNAEDVGKECVICLSEPRDTTLLPCRHMCMCSDCAKALTRQSNKCPICRQPVEKLMEIKGCSPYQTGKTLQRIHCDSSG